MSVAPFIRAKGVAVEIASAPGADQVVICTGHEASSMALAASAGLIKLWPSPPNTCLASTMANAEPMSVIHHGSEGGTFMAKSSPVTTADKSLMVTFLFMAF